MPTKNDIEIRGDLENELVWDTRIHSSGIDIEVVDGVVILDGEVNLIREKKVAEQDTWSILGVMGVENKISVYRKHEPEIVSVSSEKALQVRLREKFNWDSNLNTSKIDIEVDKGVVDLTGTVDLLWKKGWAEIQTENTLGVVQVNNLIKITPFEDVTDEIIFIEIMESLTRKLTPKHLNDFKIIVNDGIVSLEGIVLNDRIWSLLLDTASITSGVVKIEDKLRLKTD